MLVRALFSWVAPPRKAYLYSRLAIRHGTASEASDFSVLASHRRPPFRFPPRTRLLQKRKKICFIHSLNSLSFGSNERVIKTMATFYSRPALRHSTALLAAADASVTAYQTPFRTARLPQAQLPPKEDSPRSLALRREAIRSLLSPIRRGMACSGPTSGQANEFICSLF